MSNAEEGTGDGDDNSTHASSNSSASTNDGTAKKRSKMNEGGYKSRKRSAQIPKQRKCHLGKQKQCNWNKIEWICDSNEDREWWTI